MLLNIWVLWIGRKCLLIRLLLFGINVRKFLKGDILQNLSMGKFSRGMKGQLRGALLVKMPARHGLTVSWRSVAMLLGTGITMKDYDEMEDKTFKRLATRLIYGCTIIVVSLICAIAYIIRG